MPRTTTATLRTVVEVAPKVSVGLSTVAGLVAAVGQYAAALVAALEAGADSTTTIGLITTATVTLVTTIGGRMAQAAAAVKVAQPDTLADVKRRAENFGLTVTNVHNDPGPAFQKVAENSTNVGLEHQHGDQSRDQDIDKLRAELAEQDGANQEDRSDEFEAEFEVTERDEFEAEAGPELGPDEADDGGLLEPDYPGRAPAGSSRDEQMTSRLQHERAGDACAPVQRGGQS